MGVGITIEAKPNPHFEEPAKGIERGALPIAILLRGSHNAFTVRYRSDEEESSAEMSAWADAPDLRCQFSPPVVFVPPHGEATVEMTVVVASDAPSGERPIRMEFFWAGELCYSQSMRVVIPEVCPRCEGKGSFQWVYCLECGSYTGWQYAEGCTEEDYPVLFVTDCGHTPKATTPGAIVQPGWIPCPDCHGIGPDGRQI